jgi:3-dehydroquinate synthase
MRSGLAEMLKHGLIYDQEYWEQFLDLKADFADFDPLIYRSIEIKNEIVMQDPTEKNIRKALNFGHTLGHAIESYFLENDTKTTLLHGEAIARNGFRKFYFTS